MRKNIRRLTSGARTIIFPERQFMKYIDKYSYKSFLSTQSKTVLEQDGIFCWRTRKNNQLSSDHILTDADIPLLKSLAPFNFFYFDPKDVELLKNSGFNVKARKDPDITIPIKHMSLTGKKFKGLRGSINKAEKYELTIQDHYNNYDDILKMLARWSMTIGAKYFQDRSGKHKYFFKENLEKDCINIFMYDKEKLVSFAVISPPNLSSCSSYVAGKALSIDLPGLSEYTDWVAYERAALKGVEYVSLGGGGKSMRNYKMKFPGAFALESYDGTAELKGEK